MYTLKKQIIGVKSFLTYNNELYFEKDNDIYIDEKKSDLPELPRITKNGYLVINKRKNKFVIMQNNSVCTEYKNEKSIAYYINSFCLLSKSEAIGGIISYDNKLMKVIYENQGIYDITTGNLIRLFEIDKIFSFVFNTSEVAIFQNDATYIIGYSIKTNHPLWQFDLSQLGTFQDYHNEQQYYKIEKFIGIYQNEILVACNGQKLLSIDIQTGKLLQTWDDIPADKMQLDKQAGKLIGLSDFIYAEVDLNTRETLVKNIKNNIKEAGLRAFKGGRDMPFTGTHIFYTAYGRDKKTDYLFDAVIAFNRHTYKIDWMYRIDTSVGTNSPKIAGNKLYQLDLDGNLYIFEKEENNTQT